MRFDEIPGERRFMRRYTSSCGHVTGVLSIWEKGAGILEWQSDAPGFTVAALVELKAQFKRLGAIGIGSDESDPSWQYWLHMANKGLVDSLEDDEGRLVPMPVSIESETQSVPV